MSSSRELLTRLEDLEFSHPAFDAQITSLRQRVDLALAGFSSRIEWILGPSGVGKSKLIEVLARENEEKSRVNGRRRAPLVVASVPERVSPQHLPGCVITALGLPAPSGNLGKWRSFMYSQLKSADTKVILFEEASHIVDDGNSTPPRAAGDFFKGLHDNKIGVFLFGLPRLRHLRENEQVRRRSAAPREFHAYDSRVTADRTAFVACLNVYAKVFREAGWPIALSDELLFSHCYLHTGGLIGYLFAFMHELAVQRSGDSPRELTFTDCQAAAARTESAGDARWPAFRSLEVVAPAHLHMAHAKVLEDNLMPIRIADSGTEVQA